jgi:ribonuclease D
MAILENPATYQPAPEDAWRKIKARGGSAAFQGRLHVLAAWREDEAIRRNYNRTRVMRDETILKLAAEPPASADDIRRFPGIGKPAIETADQLYAAIRSAQPMRSPPPPPWASHPLPALDLLKLLLRIRCQQEDVAEKLVASSDDLDKLAWYAGTADIPALKGWRREVFGNDALALMEGKLSLTYDAGEKRVKLSG